MSKYGVISGPYFPVFSSNTGKYWPEITPYLDTFHAVIALICFSVMLFNCYDHKVFSETRVFFKTMDLRNWSQRINRYLFNVTILIDSWEKYQNILVLFSHFFYLPLVLLVFACKL